MVLIWKLRDWNFPNCHEFYNLALFLLAFSLSAEKTRIYERGLFLSINKCTPRVSTMTGWNKFLAKRRNSARAQATLLCEQHFACCSILIWGKQNRAIPGSGCLWKPSLCCSKLGRVSEDRIIIISGFWNYPKSQAWNSSKSGSLGLCSAMNLSLVVPATP